MKESLESDTALKLVKLVTRWGERLFIYSLPLRISKLPVSLAPDQWH